MERLQNQTSFKEGELRPDFHDGRLPSSPYFVFKTLQIWPEIPRVSIGNYVDRNLEAIDGRLSQGKINVNEANIMRAKFRAVDYFCGRGKDALNENGYYNPLVDILVLVAESTSHSKNPDKFALGIPEMPAAKPLITKPVGRLAEQRIDNDNPVEPKEQRTLSRFGNELRIVVRSLYVISESIRHNPELLDRTIRQYCKKIHPERTSVDGVAVGLLEILKNSGLLYDGRFYPLTDGLRSLVFNEIGNYDELTKKYPYRVIEDRPFWHQGEVKHRKDKPLKYIEVPESERVESKGVNKFNLPNFPEWDNAVRQRKSLLSQIKRLTLISSLNRSIPSESEDTIIANVVGDRAKRADLTVQTRLLQRKEKDNLRRTWTQFIDREIEDAPSKTQTDAKLLTESILKVLNYFKEDLLISQKAKTNIGELGNDNEYYKLAGERLLQNHLFTWILALRDPATARGFRNAIVESPESFESFYLLLKLLAYEAIHESFHAKENDFLFDPDYKQKLDKEGLLTVFDEIAKLASKYVPDVRELVAEVLAKGDTPINDLLSYDFEKRVQRHLTDLTYKKFFHIFLKDRSRQITKEDKQRVKDIITATLVASGIVAMVGGLYYGLDKAIDYFADRDYQAHLKEENEKAQEAERIRDAGNRMDILNNQALDEIRNGGTEAIGTGITPEMFVSQFPKEYRDRLPDAIAEAVKENGIEKGVFVYGKIIHLPEAFSGVEGEAIAYFPMDQAIKVNDYETDYDLAEWFSIVINGKYERPIVQDISMLSSWNQLNIQPQQLAIELVGVNPHIYAPSGWKVAGVYQMGGELAQAYITDIYFNESALPTKAVVVYEQIETVSLHSRIQLLEGINTESSSAWVYPGDLENVPPYLANDPQLQKLVTDFLTEMNSTTENYFTDGVDYSNQSEIAIKYAELFAEYTDKNRFYALDFQINKGNPTNYEALVSISEQKDKGYFCSVAANAFRDFMAVGGIPTLNVPGFTLYNYSGYLMGTIAHQNNIVVLPDGRIMLADMTPYSTEKSTVEDRRTIEDAQINAGKAENYLRSLDDLSSPAQENQNETDSTNDNPERITIEDLARMNEIDPNLLLPDEQLKLVGGIREAAVNMLALNLNASRANSNSLVDKNTGEVISSLRSIVAKTELLFRLDEINSYNIKNERVNVDEIFSYYQLLLEIQKLGEALPADSEGFKEIADSTNQLVSGIEYVAADELIEGRVNEFMRETIKGEYLTFEPYWRKLNDRKARENEEHREEKARFERMIESRRETNEYWALRKADTEQRREQHELYLKFKERERQLANEARMAEIVEDIKNSAQVLGVGIIPLAIGYFGLSMARSRKKSKAVLELINSSLQETKDLTTQEKEMVVAAAGHLSLLTYDVKFPEKAMAVLNLVKSYDKEVHSQGLNWLMNEGIGILSQESSEDAMQMIKDIVAGKTIQRDEVLRMFPDSISVPLKTGTLNGRVPYDFFVIYSLARLIMQHSLNGLMREVYDGLELPHNLNGVAVNYKETDLLTLLKTHYAQTTLNPETKAIFNAVYRLIRSE